MHTHLNTYSYVCGCECGCGIKHAYVDKLVSPVVNGCGLGMANSMYVDMVDMFGCTYVHKYGHIRMYACTVSPVVNGCRLGGEGGGK